MAGTGYVLRFASLGHGGASRPLTSLVPSIIYRSCRSVAQLDGMRLHSGDMAHIRDRAPVICRGFP
jgi:hypothetical protein